MMLSYVNLIREINKDLEEFLKPQGNFRRESAFSNQVIHEKTADRGAFFLPFINRLLIFLVNP